MSKLLIGLAGLLLTGCYSTTVFVSSSYDLVPRGRVERQPDPWYEARPFLELNPHLVVSFNRVPGRHLKPDYESCESSMDDSLHIQMYSDQGYQLDLSKTVAKVNGKSFHIANYRPYGTEEPSTVRAADYIKVGLIKDGFSDFRQNINKDFNKTYDQYVNRREVYGAVLIFDEKFSCGEENFELDVWFNSLATNSPEKYTIYFFPWKRAVTPR
ncbi:hypothetical protein EMM73_19540 [Rheinheimera sediminis]|uniref:hypothetical protein n=1 Tax=Rheinheimera sp. YQF-1 TaxID=2499626 RepID=UPI000FD8E4E9|nr:hypothetical protein [Rheinheimera sp. YQF-1]RVT40554.1 hypothetical protein EMM73_19540 [Rheinheimera sp. YQF-1]